VASKVNSLVAPVSCRRWQQNLAAELAGEDSSKSYQYKLTAQFSCKSYQHK
jgi:hypothetical protein